MTTLPLRADPATRRANQRAVEARARWREKYNLLVAEIKAAKRAVHQDPQGRASKIRLQSLQLTAEIMMMDRALIQNNLVETAYEWV